MSAPSRGRSGRYYDGFTATIRPVSLEMSGASIVLKDADGHTVKHWRCDDIRIAEDLPGQGYRLELSGGERQRLVVEHPDAIKFIDEHCPNLRKGAGWSWQAAKPYVIRGGGALASVLLLFFVVIPAAAPKIVAWVPDSYARRLGAQVEKYLILILARGENLEPDAMVCTSPEGDAALAKVVTQLARTAGTDAVVKVIRVDQPNALALPGGRILVFSGLLRFANAPNEVAAVLAHEMGHVSGRHGLQRVVESSVTGATIGLLFGDMFGATALAIMGDALLNGVYSRDKEREADNAAVTSMAANGWTARPISNLFRRMEREGGDSSGPLSLLSSHPSYEDRIDLFQNVDGVGAPAWTDPEWKAIKSICGDG